jgi:predicted transposase YbfD/YdcC
MLGCPSTSFDSNYRPAIVLMLSPWTVSVKKRFAVVTADAMHCQTETANAIVSKDADYILTVKGNQPALQEVLNTTLLKAMDNEDPKLRRCQSGETTRRRAEIRELVVLPASKHRSVLAGWKGIKAIGLIYRSRRSTDKYKNPLRRKRTAAYSVFWGRGACKCSVVDFAKDPAAPLTPHTSRPLHPTAWPPFSTGALAGGVRARCYTQVSDSSIWILVRNFANKR